MCEIAFNSVALFARCPQFKSSQDANNCNGAAAKSNPLNIASAVGKVPGAARKRVIGTGEMVATLQAATTDTLGYFFWSAGNASNLSNAKYLTVNGIDEAYGLDKVYSSITAVPVPGTLVLLGLGLAGLGWSRRRSS